MKRLARHTRNLLAVAFAAAVVFAGWMMLTGSGLRFAWRVAQAFVPGTIRVERVEGRLVGPLAFVGIELDVEGVRLRLRRAEIEWSPAALARRRLDIESLRLIGFDLAYAPAPPRGEPAAAFALPANIRLPLDLAIGGLSIDGGRVRSSADEAGWVFDRLQLGLRLDQRLEVSNLVLRSAELDLDGRFGMSTGGDYVLDASLAWAARLADLPPLAGTTGIAGSAEALMLDQVIGAPYGIDAEIVIESPLAEPRLTGEIVLDTAVDALGRNLPADEISGRIGLDGGLDDLAISGALSSTAPALGNPVIDFEARYRPDAIEVGSLSLGSPDSAARIDLSGRIGVAVEPAIALAGTWAALQWPLSGAPRATSPAGRLDLSGTVQELRAELAAEIAGGTVEGSVTRRGASLDADLSWAGLGWLSGEQQVSSERGALEVEGRLDDYRLTLDADLTAEPGTSGHVRAAGRGDLNGLELERIDIAVLDGMVLGSAALRWEQGFTGSTEFGLTNVDPGVLAPAWPGRIDGRVAASIGQSDDALTVSAEDVDLTGTLRERPLTLRLQGRYETPRRATIDRLDLRLGESTLAAAGSIGSTLAFEWSLDSPRLDDLWPGLVGRLATTGRIAGPRDRPLLDIDATGIDLALAENRAAMIELAARIDTSGGSGSQLELAVRDAWAADRHIDSLTVAGSGDAARHTLRATLGADIGTAELELSGRFETTEAAPLVWSFDLERARVDPSSAGIWTLSEPASGRITDGAAILDFSCWLSNEASLCFGGAYGRERTTASFILGNLPLGLFAQYLPADAVLIGAIDGRGELELGSEAPPRLDVELATSAGWIGTGTPDTDAGLAFAPGRASAAWNSDGLTLEAELPLAAASGGIELAATVAARPDQALDDATLEGRFAVAINDLGFIAALTRQVTDTSGSLAADLGFSGTVAAPRLQGRVDLTDGTARLSTPGIVLDGVEAELSTDGNGALNLSASARSGTGALEATGLLSFDESLPVGEITLTGESFEIIGTPTLRVLASPDLRLELTPDRAELSGRLLVPTASITPPDLGEGIARATPDEVIVDAEQPSRATLLRPLYANVELELGEDVMFDGLGLAGRLAGGLEITETPNEPASGSGELRIEQGTYEAYRQTLEIRRGRLVFAGGSLMRPGIDIEAMRRPTSDILVGARVSGTLEQPELTLFSEPSMPRQELLSYLLLGRPLERASTDESTALSQAALLLGMSGGNALSERINRSLGFDEFGIRTEAGETNTASFVLGRYLAPSLYVSYGIGLYDQVNTLRLRYSISERWRLETESSSERAGGDVFFHIERGR